MKISNPLPLRQIIRPAVFLQAPRIGKPLGIGLTLAVETFQHTGSFKFRAAYNVASQVPQNRLITASSGNFGQALAYACSMLGKICTVVMPTTSPKVKVEGVRENGGKVEFVDTQRKPRSERLKELAAEFPDSYIASPYDDPLVIEGNSSLGEELCDVKIPLDMIVAPIGGGGLSSGIIAGIHRLGKTMRVIGAEPEIANDASRSLKAGYIVSNDTEPQTIADGAASLCIGQHNWAILKDGLSGIVEVSEEMIKMALRRLFLEVNLKAEPTGALSVAALLTEPSLFRGRSICCIISGGNIDPAKLCSIMQ